MLLIGCLWLWGQFQLTLVFRVALHTRDGLIGGFQVKPVMCQQDFLQVVFARDFNKPVSVKDIIGAIKLANNAQVVQGCLQVLSEGGDDARARFFVNRGNRKIVDLTKQESNGRGSWVATTAKAFVVRCGPKMEILHQDFVNMLLPEAR